MENKNSKKAKEEIKEEIKEIKSFSEKEIKEKLKQLKGWKFLKERKILAKFFKFKDFEEVIDFICELAGISKRINHYPEKIIIQFAEVIVELSTKEIKGVGEKDIALAEQIEEIVGWRMKVGQWLRSPKVVVPLALIFFLVLLWIYFFK